jgi:tetratricopeptide (TPR) repeat protein
MRRWIVLGALLGGVLATAPEVRAQQATMREGVYEKLSQAEAHAEAGEYGEALAKLADVERMRSLGAYEKAQLYTAYGFVYFRQDDLPKAIGAYEKVLQQPGLPEGVETGTRYTLAQLQFQAGDYRAAIAGVSQWLETATNPGANPYILLGQAYYQLKEYEQAVPAVNQAIEITRAQGKRINENWYLLLRLFHYELGNYPEVIRVLEQLISEYPKKEYWLQLAAMHGETGATEKRLAIYGVAHAQGMLATETEQVLYAQLLLQAGIPYKAGTILRAGIESGTIEKTASNYRLLSQAWTLAQEDSDAIEALVAAARLSGDGELDARLAQSYLNLGNFAQSAEAARSALKKGVNDSDQVQVLLGMALCEMDRYDDARQAFRRAQESPGSRDTASQWIAFLDREQAREAALESSFR